MPENELPLAPFISKAPTLQDTLVTAPVDQTSTQESLPTAPFLNERKPAERSSLDPYLNTFRSLGVGGAESAAEQMNTFEQWRKYVGQFLTTPTTIPMVGIGGSVSQNTIPPVMNQEQFKKFEQAKITLPEDTGIAPLNWLGKLSNELNAATVDQKTGEYNSLAKQQREKLSEIAKNLDQSIKDVGGMNKYAYHLAKGIGRLAVDLPTIAVEGLPVYMGLKGGADAIQYSQNVIEGVVKGGAEGAAYHTIFKWLNMIPKIDRVAAGGAIFGAPSIAAELQKDPKDRDWSRAVADVMIGGGMVINGPSGREYRKSFYNQVWSDLSKSNLRMNAAKKKAILRNFVKGYENSGKSILQALEENKDQLGLSPEEYKQVQDYIMGAGARWEVREDINKKVENKESPEAQKEHGVEIPDFGSKGIGSVAQENSLELTGSWLAQATYNDILTAEKWIQDRVNSKKDEKGEFDTLIWIRDFLGRSGERSDWANQVIEQRKQIEYESFKQSVVPDTKYIGDQEHPSKGKVPLFNIVKPGHEREGSTVSAETIKKLGLSFPEGWTKDGERIPVKESDALLENSANEIDAVRKDIEDFPTLEEMDPLTGRELTILPKLLNTVDWLAQNEKRADRFSAWANKVEDAMYKLTEARRDVSNIFSIEANFRPIDGDETGRSIVRINSIRDVYEREWGIQSVKKVARDLNYDESLMRELPFAVEDMKHPLRDDPKVKPVIEFIEKQFEDAYLKLESRGGLRQPWKERVLKDIRNELQEPNVTEGRKKLLNDMLKRVKDTEFVHIPTQMWLEKSLNRNTGNRYEVMRQMLTIKAGAKRKSIRLADLVKTPDNPDGFINPRDIHIRDVLADYGRRLGHDIALLEVRQAAIQDGLAIKRKPGRKPPKGKESYESAPFQAPVFYGLDLHPVLKNWIWEITGRPLGTNIVRKGIKTGMSMYKMAQFYNPLFLPMYDVFQAGMLSNTGFIKHLPAAYKDWKAVSDAWKESGVHGLRSQPYANVLANYQRDVIRNSRRFSQNLLQVWNLSPHTWVREAYNASWNTAWAMDGIIRQSSYRYLLEQGYSSKDAARLAALFHGDYANVPPRTREALNYFFFTPTFKIAMAKLHKDMIKGAIQSIGKTKWEKEVIGKYGEGLTGKKTFIEKNKWLLLKSLMTTYGMMTTWDLFMTQTMGFQREDWGWKYKKVIMNEKGQRELHIGFTNPANMWVNEVHRLEDAFKPVNDNALRSWLTTQRSKEHPLWKDVDELVNNYNPDADPAIPDPKNPDMKMPIWKRFDIPENQRLDRLEWSVQHFLPLLDAIQPDEKSSKVNEALVKETSKLFELITRPFTFRYTTPTVSKKLTDKITKLEGELEKQIYQFGKEEGAGPEQQEAFKREILLLKKELDEELMRRSVNKKENK